MYHLESPTMQGFWDELTYTARKKVAELLYPTEEVALRQQFMVEETERLQRQAWLMPLITSLPVLIVGLGALYLLSKKRKRLSGFTWDFPNIISNNLGKLSGLWRIMGVDLTSGKIDRYKLGYTDDLKAARAHYKEQGWSLKHNYKKPFVTFHRA